MSTTVVSMLLFVFHYCSKYVPRGSVRISNMVSNTSLECTAFLTPSNQVVVVVMNTGDSDITFKLMDINTASTQAVQVIALAHSIQTFVYL